MTVLRPHSEFLSQDSIADVEDLYTLTKATETYRAAKVVDLKNEHALVMRKIDRITEQKAAYIRVTGVLPSSEDMKNIMPVIKNNGFDVGNSELASDSDTNKKLLIRRHTDPILNVTKDMLRENISEIDICLRNYNYQLLKLSWMEKRITYHITEILKKETTAQQAV